MADRNQISNDPEEVHRIALEGLQSNLWTACPGIIKAINWAHMTVSVQPAIQGIVSNEDGTTTSVNLPLLVDVPINFPSAGGFIITFPLAVNNEVLVVFASRCIDAWWQSGGIQRPMEARMHDLSDGFAIPGPRSLPNVVTGISTTNLQIRNDAGTSYVEIDSAGKIKLVAPAEIDITAPLVKVTGSMTISGTLVVTGAITGAAITGSSLATSGGGGASVGALTATTVTAGGVGLTTHHHSGVQTGGGITGGPSG